MEEGNKPSSLIDREEAAPSHTLDEAYTLLVEGDTTYLTVEVLEGSSLLLQHPRVWIASWYWGWDGARNGYYGTRAHMTILLHYTLTAVILGDTILSEGHRHI